MKKGVLIIGIALFGAGAVTVNAALENESAVVVVAKEKKKVEIKADELPADAVKTLAEQYKDTQISKTYKWVDEAGTIVGYEVVLNSGAGELIVKFGPKGELVKE